MSERRELKLRGSAATILVVDDDDPVRAVTAEMLRDLGYRVQDVADGKAALKALAASDDIDVLLSDLVMSGMNGVQLAAMARATRPGLLIVFISGYADQVSDTIDPQDPLIRKPFNASDLHNTIEAELAERRRVLSKA